MFLAHRPKNSTYVREVVPVVVDYACRSVWPPSTLQNGLGAVFDQSSGRVPLAECGGIGVRGAAAGDGAGCFDVGTCSYQCVNSVDVVAAGGPVQQCFGVATDAGCVGIGAGRGQRVDDRRDDRVVAGPVVATCSRVRSPWLASRAVARGRAFDQKSAATLGYRPVGRLRSRPCPGGVSTVRATAGEWERVAGFRGW